VEIIAEWVTLKNSINSITYQDPIEDSCIRAQKISNEEPSDKIHERPPKSESELTDRNRQHPAFVKIVNERAAQLRLGDSIDQQYNCRPADSSANSADKRNKPGNRPKITFLINHVFTLKSVTPSENSSQYRWMT
jgi:hypothetical protein